jgi:YegS/Rv2252/BmrU family lipid kinase
MPGRIVIILNKGSGRSPLPEKFDALKTAAAKQGLAPDFVLVTNGEEAEERAHEAALSGAEIVAAAGGDGTLSAVAQGLMGTSAKLGVLPLGTFNHFAADLGIPADIDGALEVIKRGVAEAVDVAEINRQIFLNNSSIGIYPRLVHERDEERRKTGKGKLSAFVTAFWKILRKYPSLTIKIKMGGQELTRKTSFVFVGNNEYILEGLRMGRREGLTQGYLDIGVVERSSRRDLIRVFLKALFGRLGKDPYFDEYRVQEARIDSRRRFLPVAMDGEVKLFRTPLNFKIRPKALTVMLPRLSPA